MQLPTFIPQPPTMHAESDLLKRVREYSESLLSERLPDVFLYHNLEHTREVVEAARKIGKHSGLDKKDLDVVMIAAWLHDTGYCNGTSVEHEEASIKVATQFLKEQKMVASQLDEVIRCIRATKMPQQPEGILAEVLCDADLNHLASDTYQEKAELLRKELSIIQEKDIDEQDWQEINVQFLRNHIFFTTYAKSELQPLQAKNLKKLEKRIKKAGKKEEKQEGKLEQEIEKLKGKLEEEKKSKPGRGVETMFRTTSANHLQLSNIADNKANIMISINSIIVSLMVSVLIRKFEEFPNLIIPTAILTTVCLMTIVFAILATRPNVTSGMFTRDDIYNKRSNLLFFGNFHQMSLQDYEWGMKEILKDSDLLYTSMIQDIYFLGKVLGRKYRLLRISYTIFMFGFVISIISYAIALIFFPVY